jgi:hypothetical protein
LASNALNDIRFAPNSERPGQSTEPFHEGNRGVSCDTETITVAIRCRGAARTCPTRYPSGRTAAQPRTGRAWRAPVFPVGRKTPHGQSVFPGGKKH